ncbi:Lysophospholipase 1 [Pseudogymnoascus australis]
MRMKTQLIVASLACLSFCDGAMINLRNLIDEYVATDLAAPMSVADKRAAPDSPSGNYAPGPVDCPGTRLTIREANSLSANETAWLEGRRNNTLESMSSFLSRANISGFDVTAYIQSATNNVYNLPNIGIAISGGGYRALMNGAGFLAAADNRTENSTAVGQIGGLLQSSTYLSGLSGGGWLVGSIFANNFTTVVALRDGSTGSSVWEFGNSILQGPAQNGSSILNTADYYKNIVDEVGKKQDARFNASITDYYGRAISYQLVNATDGGPAYTFSSIALEENFVTGETPFPILVADERAPGTSVISLNSTVFEFNPFEMGSWDPTTYGFAPTGYLGTNFSAGFALENESCVRGFDQIGYVMGTSSSLFNQFILQLNSTGLSGVLLNAAMSALSNLNESENDIAPYQPNPFYHFNNDTNRNAFSKQLTLVDGGEDLQNIPLAPLIQPSRAVDVIFAVDASADTTYGWPNGTSLVATYQRSLNSMIENGTSFPAIPDQNTFVNQGLNKRPTFFGCDAKNTTNPTPLIVYVPNAPYITLSNISTFDLSINNTQRNAIIQNGYDVATMSNGTLDSQWQTCVACAVLSRSFTRTDALVPADCTECFNRYCWNGSLNSTTPSSNYSPTFLWQEPSISSGASPMPRSIAFMFIAAVIALLV